MFKEDEQILHFIHCENDFKDMGINDGDHHEEMNKKAPRDGVIPSNVIALLVVRMEYLYVVHDKLKKVTICKIKNSTM